MASNTQKLQLFHYCKILGLLNLTDRKSGYNNILNTFLSQGIFFFIPGFRLSQRFIPFEQGYFNIKTRILVKKVPFRLNRIQ